MRPEHHAMRKTITRLIALAVVVAALALESLITLRP